MFDDFDAPEDDTEEDEGETKEDEGTEMDMGEDEEEM